MRAWTAPAMLAVCAQLSMSAACGAGADSAFQDRLKPLQVEFAKSPTNTSLLFKLADTCYDEGAKDNAKAVLLAENYLHQLLKLEPTNALASVLLGSVLTMKARDAFWPNTRLSLAKAGNAQMDKAVAMATNDPNVRLIRAVNNFHMPRFMGREDLVKADFLWLWDKIKGHPEVMKAADRQSVAWFQGQLLNRLKNNHEAAEVWKAGVEMAPGSPTAQEIQGQLRKLKLK